MQRQQFIKPTCSCRFSAPNTFMSLPTRRRQEKHSFVLSLCGKPRPISDLYSLRFHVHELASNHSNRITRRVTCYNSPSPDHSISTCRPSRNTLDLRPSQQQPCTQTKINRPKSICSMNFRPACRHRHTTFPPNSWRLEDAPLAVVLTLRGSALVRRIRKGTVQALLPTHSPPPDSTATFRSVSSC